MTPPPPPRLGPRPLALHLLVAMGTWLGSRGALPLLKSGSLPWRLELAVAAKSLQDALAAAELDDIAGALDAELSARASSFLRGIARYRSHPYRRTLDDPPVLWQEGTTRLLDYGAAGDPPLLLVPSLINRAYILDLAPEKSLVRFLAAQGLRPLLLDWGSPGPVERDFTLTDYIAGRLETAAAAAAAAAQSELVVLGYCMGGLLALALAARQPRLVRALALLATPWRFHAERAGQARLLGALAEPLTAAFSLLGVLPVDVLQGLFASLDPLLAVRKFIRFAGLPQDSPEVAGFVALEDWLNDGVPLALPVARECLGGWYGADTPGSGCWRVAGIPVRADRITQPSLVVVPAQDRIVPPATAAALGSMLPAAERLAPRLGHIGMVAAREAPRAVWQPLAAWLKRHADSGRSLAPAGSKKPRRRLSRKNRPDASWQ
jgi:polyhydroxyalkanoate synthase subunit PhaC